MDGDSLNEYDLQCEEKEERDEKDIVKISECVQPFDVGVVKVKPVNKMEDEGFAETSNGIKSKLLRLSGRLVLPVGSLVFTLTFWLVGLFKSFSSGYPQDPDMFDCLAYDIS